MRSPSFFLRVAVALLSTSACTGEFTVPPEPGTSGVRPRCSEIGTPLAIEPRTAEVGARQLFVLHGSGGTGAYRWSVADAQSGGEIDPGAGVYLAGTPLEDGSDTLDTILLEDLGCRGEATATVTVRDAPHLMPAEVELQPGDRVSFVGSGGSGAYTFELSENVSGGSIDASSGVYTAGSTLGRDVVRLTDSMFGTQAEAIVRIVSDASLALSPRDWVVPLGSAVDLPVSGGSGAYDVVLGAGLTHVEDTTVRADAVGTSRVTFEDRFVSGRSVEANLQVVAPEDAARQHPFDRSIEHVVAGGGDLDGDGYVDAVVGMAASSGAWFESGLVYVFRGTEGGLDPAPARILEGSSRDEEFGAAVHLADLDMDGRLDLLVGARRADPIRRDVGAVHVYAGVEGGFFTDAPVRSFFGANAFDLFGDSIATCDFNGDGLLDLAVSAPFGQDPSGESNQGVVHVFLAYPPARAGDPTRFVSTPDVEILGRAIDGTGEVGPVAELRLGEDLAAGDYDGDGVCDLAARARMPEEELADSGAVLLFRGRAVEGSDRGGPEPQASLLWGRADGTDDNARFGEDLDMGDVNGDGLADLLCTRYLHDGTEGTDSGAIYVHYGRAFDAAATGITAIDAGADWSVEGLGSDRVGNGADLFDVNGDGVLDVVSGDSRAQVMDGDITRPGMVRVYYGRGGGPSTTPDLEIEGPRADDRFGAGVGGIGDLDGDGRSELLVFAPQHDTTDAVNDDRGGLFLESASGRVELQLEIHPSGQRVGFSVAWIGDLDGDGFPELAVGAPDAEIGTGRNAGTIRIHAGTANGVSAAARQELASFAEHGAGDEAGWLVTPAGDFDGDGTPDLVVYARNEDLRSLDAARYEAIGACSDRNDPGVLYVFRGRTDGTLEPDPTLVYYGPLASNRMESIVGGQDIDGDGLDDLVVGGGDWDDMGTNNVGGVAWVRGRAPAADGRIQALCEPDGIVFGTVQDARIGRAVAGLGDLDGDGCADWAAGAPTADPNAARDAGEIHVYFGFDDSGAMRCGASTALRQMTLLGQDTNSQAGLALAGGVDLDGDAVGDLVVGAPRYRDGRGEVGRAILVSGARIAANIGRAVPLVDGASTANLVMDGTSPGERLGSSVAVVRAGGGLVVLGGPFGASTGRIDTGGASIVPTSGAGFASAPRWIVAGETLGSGELGGAVSAFGRGGTAFVAVGAPWSSMVEADDGASYAFTLTP